MRKTESIDLNPLYREQAYVGGEWVLAHRTGRRFSITNPATGEKLASVPDMEAVDVRQAISAADSALAPWGRCTANERSALLRRWFDLVVANQGHLAELLTFEQGKPFKEAIGEVQYGAAYIEWFSEEAKRTYGDTIPSSRSDARILVIRQPVGVVAAITPWNFPVAMITRKVAPALAAGCTVVVKPSEETPLCALALAVLAQQAKIPPGVFNVITSRKGDAVGTVLTGSSVVRKLSFTGSTNVGKHLYRASADTVKKLSLELGGNAPFIVFDDADIDNAVDAAIASKYRNAGQTCVCANRLYIHDRVYDEFAEKLGVAVQRLIPGNGFDEGVDQGPLINTGALVKVERQLADALGKGARVTIGGQRCALGGLFFQPTVVLDAKHDMLFATEETFGPVAPLFRFSDEQALLRAANDTRAGLAAYLFSRDIGRIFRVAEALEVGMVGVNTGVMSSEVAPFGGTKESGLGREGSKYGMDDYTELKYVCIAGI